MAESVIRGKKKSFTILYNSVLQDKRLDLKTVGLFAIMQSFPDDWEYSISGLASRTGVGKGTIRKCLDRLEKAGYLLREQRHGSDGRFTCNTYVLQDEAPPCTSKPTTVKPLTVLPLSENDTQVNKHLSKQTSSNTPKAPNGGEEDLLFVRFWASYPRKQYKDRARKAWAKIRVTPELLDQMLTALEAAKLSDQWMRDEGRFIPHPATWLNGRCWEDDPGPAYKPERPPQVVPAGDNEQRGRYL